MGYDSLVKANDPNRPQGVVSSNVPALTGSLGFHIRGGTDGTARRLLELPDGLHFRKLALSWIYRRDLWWITKSVARRSHALWSPDVAYNLHRTCVHIRGRVGLTR